MSPDFYSLYDGGELKFNKIRSDSVTMKLEKKHPIGVFDSGIGGLTVAHAIKKLLPGESMIYFGDTAHLPYGDKSEAAIQRIQLRLPMYCLKRGAR